MPRVGQASRLSREEKTGWKPVPLCGQVPGTGCSDKWFSPSRKGRRQNSAYSPSKITKLRRVAYLACDACCVETQPTAALLATRAVAGHVFVVRLSQTHRPQQAQRSFFRHNRQ